MCKFDFGAPLSTSTMPSAAETATTLLPPASSTASLSFCALRNRGAANTIALFNSSLRFTLDPWDDARAVAELLALHPRLLQNRQMQIRNRRALRQHDMLPNELHFAVAAAHQDIRLRIVVMQVAVTHVRPVHEHRVIQQTSLPIRRFRHLLDECGELLHVPGLNLHQLVDSIDIV